VTVSWLDVLLLVVVVVQVIKDEGMGDTFTDEEIDEMMNAADTNGDGTIDYKGI